MKKKPNLGKQILSQFVPVPTIDYIDSLVRLYRVNFKIVNPRKTKLGDCRFPLQKDAPITITVNIDLPPIQFLITTLHELAHAKTFREYQNKVAPHGKEWKNNFKELFQPILNEQYLNFEEINIIMALLKNVSATSSGNHQLNDFLFKDNPGVTFLKDIPHEKVFVLNERKFKIISKARTRYLCEEIKSKRKYKIHGLAQVSSDENDIV